MSLPNMIRERSIKRKLTFLYIQYFKMTVQNCSFLGNKYVPSKQFIKKSLTVSFTIYTTVLANKSIKELIEMSTRLYAFYNF